MKQLINTIVMLLALLLPALATAHDFEVDGIYYNINDNKATVTYYCDPFSARYSGSVVIPATVTYNGTTYPVTSIGHKAFYNCSGLTSVDIPKSVNSIGQEALAYCTRLTSIDIPNSVTAIGYCAFDSTAWYNNQPDGLVYAGKVAYKYKGTMPSGTNMTLKEGTLGIAVAAFEGCTGMTSIVIPNSVTDIGERAFTGCPGLTSIVVESGNTKYDSRNNCNAIIESAKNSLIVGCKNTIIPKSVTDICDYAFYDCTGLTSINIPKSVTDIWDFAFAGCTGLTSINIPKSVTDIWDFAFAGCTGLISINIPKSVTDIGDGAFEGCTGLSSIVVPKSVTDIGDGAFEGCTGLSSIVIPKSVTEIGSRAFGGCSGLTDVYCYIADISIVSSGDQLFYKDVNWDYSGCTLHVLQGTADAYRADENWYPYFGQIVEDIFVGD